MPMNATIDTVQNLIVRVNGPDDINTMFISSGLARAPYNYQSPQGQGQNVVLSFAALLPEPQLTAAQFRRATAMVSLAGVSAEQGGGPTALAPTAFAVSVTSIDADFDDESGHIRLHAPIRSKFPAARFHDYAHDLFQKHVQTPIYVCGAGAQFC